MSFHEYIDIRVIVQALLVFVVFTFITGILYPFLITGLAQIFFPHQANGSFVEVHGKIIGSELIGQNFTGEKYFHGRPSAVDYSANLSGTNNFGPTNPTYLSLIQSRVDQIRRENNLNTTTPIPADLILDSASGLDPHISIETALIQVHRVASARGISEEKVRDLVLSKVEYAEFGLLSANRVNVLELNIALDSINQGVD